MSAIKPYTYLIKFKPTNKFYYGSRVKNVKLGLEPEQDLMKKYTTSSREINSLIKEHGLDAFEWEVRKTFNTIKEAVDWEKRVLTKCKVLYNRDKWFNGNVAGYIIPTKESIKKISEFHKGKPKSEEHKTRIRDANKGKKRTVEQKQKMSENMKGRYAGNKNPMSGPCSEERKANISKSKKGKVAHNKGIPMSEDQKAKIRATKLANPFKMSADAIAKRSAKIIGQKRSAETKAKMSQSAKLVIKGPMSDEAKEKISKSTTGKKKSASSVEKRADTLKKLAASGQHHSTQKKTCPHCGTEMNRILYGRWHGDKCKQNPIKMNK